MKKGRSSKNVVDKRGRGVIRATIDRVKVGAVMTAQDLGLKSKTHKPSGPEHPLTKSARKYVERKKKR